MTERVVWRSYLRGGPILRSEWVGTSESHSVSLLGLVWVLYHPDTLNLS